MQNDKLVDLDHVLLSLSLKLVEHKKLEDISNILTNFQTSTLFSFSEIPILTRNITYFEWQNDKLVDFDHFPLCYSLKLVEHKKLEDISDILTNFQTSI